MPSALADAPGRDAISSLLNAKLVRDEPTKMNTGSVSAKQIGCWWKLKMIIKLSCKVLYHCAFLESMSRRQRKIISQNRGLATNLSVDWCTDL